MIKTQNQFRKMVDLAIKINQNARNRITLVEYKTALGKTSFAMEYATVKIDLGRQLGKTTYIKDKLEHDENSIVVLNSKASITNNYKSVSDKTIVINKYNCAKTIEIENLDKIKNVYIDDASWNDTVEVVYEIFTQDDIERTFVLLG